MAPDPNDSAAKVNYGESATTREEMDFDDPATSPQQETGRVSPLGHETIAPKPPPKSPSPRPRVSFSPDTQEIPPTKPPRSTSPMAQSEHTLIEAFPSIDTKVVKAVLMASGGQVEPAFNALLGMSDPDFKPEEAQQPPPQPPRPQRAPRNQLEADELYARQLADQYNAQAHGGRGVTGYNQREPGRRGPNSQGARYDYDEDRERSFIDDDLPEIGRNIQQGFFETQKRVNSWITNFKKKLDGDEEEDDLYSGSSSQQPSGQQGRQNFGSSQSEQLYGIRKSTEGQRRSVDQQRYDADPHVLDDEEFSRLELRDEESPPPQLPRRPPQSGSVDEVEHAERRGQDPDKARKWQPLTSVAPHPEDDNDPFSVGDDDEKDDKVEDQRKDDTERLKEAAKKSISEGTGGKSSEGLTENETTGSKNADMEKILNKD